jgi:hypothetical protein
VALHERELFLRLCEYFVVSGSNANKKQTPRACTFAATQNVDAEDLHIAKE